MNFKFILSHFRGLQINFRVQAPLSKTHCAVPARYPARARRKAHKLKFLIYYPLIFKLLEISNFFWKYFYSYCHCYCYFGPTTIYLRCNTHLLDYLDKKQHPQSLKKFSDSELSLAIANKISECKLNLATAN